MKRTAILYRYYNEVPGKGRLPLPTFRYHFIVKQFSKFLCIMRYFASFIANNGSTYNKRPYEYSNKKFAIKDIRSIVYGNHFFKPCSTSRYMVWNDDGIIVASGYLHGNGRWSINDDQNAL